MSNSARKGNSAELRVARYFEGRGWVVASRRHVGGAGDLLMARGERKRGPSWTEHRMPIVFLVEVKANRDGGPYANFRKADRDAMSKAAKQAGAQAWLAYLPPGEEVPRMLEETMWPGAKRRRKHE